MNPPTAQDVSDVPITPSTRSCSCRHGLIRLLQWLQDEEPGREHRLRICLAMSALVCTMEPRTTSGLSSPTSSPSLAGTNHPCNSFVNCLPPGSFIAAETDSLPGLPSVTWIWRVSLIGVPVNSKVPVVPPSSMVTTPTSGATSERMWVVPDRRQRSRDRDGNSDTSIFPRISP